ncbi:hypothetical protein SASPL_138113 [Salvia splendens]|uniref:LRR receptor-like serine/threonine-protein kinase FLS2 n=1 Tax=Salvia splendens TaxID=180675 RepID=A0A8X8ZDK8_SALSN|nr:hypothetical protein SASPL_138113 [Salvia splendens]
MLNEFNALLKNKTWILTALPPGKNLIGCTWIFKLKFHLSGVVARHKAMLVAQGFSQQPGFDFNETFSPVVKPTTIRIILSIAVSLGFSQSRADVSMFFRHQGDEVIYLLIYVDDMIITGHVEDECMSVRAVACNAELMNEPCKDQGVCHARGNVWSNSLSGPLPRNLYTLTRLQEISLPNNQLSGPMSKAIVNLSNLIILELHANQLSALDLGNNTFRGSIPDTLCLCKSITAIRLSFNQLSALNTLKHYQNLAVLFLSKCFHDERIPNNDSDNSHIFKNLEILTLGGCKLKGQIPNSISKLKKLNVLNLSFNKISAQFQRGIPTEIGQLKLLQVLELSKNNLRGSIPEQLSNMANLEKLDMSGNDLTGEIPKSLTKLHFLSALSVADDDPEGGGTV